MSKLQVKPIALSSKIVDSHHKVIVKLTGSSCTGKIFKNEEKEIKRIGSKAEVFHGSAFQTSGGLKKVNLIQLEDGRIVSKLKHAAGKRIWRSKTAAEKAEIDDVLSRGREARRRNILMSKRRGSRSGSPRASSAGKRRSTSPRR